MSISSPSAIAEWNELNHVIHAVDRRSIVAGGADALRERQKTAQRGVLGDRKLVEVQTSSQSPMARCRSRSVKDEVYCKVIV